MHLDCPYKARPGFSNHDSNQQHVSSKWVTSRSYDGGETWDEHRTTFPDLRANPGGSQPKRLKAPIDFSDDDTIVNFHWDGLGVGARTYFYYSTDRGREWHGPCDNIPLFDFVGMAGRTDYQTAGKRHLTAYIGCLEAADPSCYRESSFAIVTDDGGVTWKKGPRISRELPPCGRGHRIEYGAMPSTVRLDGQTLLSTFRSGYTPAKGRRTGWIDVTRSMDNGKSWRLVNGHLMEMPTLNSSPPALSRLPSGRLVCSWGWRLPDDGSGPTAIQARVSEDYGETWGRTIILRRDGYDYDIGYNRQVVRPDGKVVTVYYYRTVEDGQSPTYIAATIWNP
jgi:Neuraminidase (sialidase)